MTEKEILYLLNEINSWELTSAECLSIHGCISRRLYPSQFGIEDPEKFIAHNDFDVVSEYLDKLILKRSLSLFQKAYLKSDDQNEEICNLDFQNLIKYINDKKKDSAGMLGGISKFQKDIGDSLGHIPVDFDELFTQSKQFSSAARQMLAARLEPALNDYLSTLPANTLDEKKAICAKIEEVLEPLGLAVQVPREPFIPGKLKATTGDWPGKGCFQFQVMVNGKQKKPATSNTLPLLKLVDSYREVNTAVASDPEKNAGDWQEKIGSKAERKGRRVD